jgi:DNA-binding CsgD family transcriptional regulator
MAAPSLHISHKFSRIRVSDRTQTRTFVLYLRPTTPGVGGRAARAGITPTRWCSRTAGCHEVPLVPREVSEATLIDVLRRIEAAAAALPSCPNAALRELRSARTILLAPLRHVPVTAIEPDPRLTVREREVLRLLAQGNRNKEIALSLGLRERTVKFHVANVLRKLDVQSRTEALRRALELGMLDAGGPAPAL